MPLQDLSEIALFILGFLLLVSLVCLTLRSLSGWHRLRRLYAATRVNLIKRWPFESAEIRLSLNFDGLLGRFNRCMTFGYSAEGVFIAGVFPFLIFFQPVLIPWDDIVLTEIDGKGLFSTKLPEISIITSSRVFDGLVASGMGLHFEGLGDLAAPQRSRV
jgi:hypothetical protein